MNKLLQSRKGVSPLIATVLLIAFAVALGAVVMNWGRGYVEDTANVARERSDAEITCTTEVGLAVVEIDNVPQICYNTSTDTVEFILENRKAQEIDKVQMRIIGSKTRVPSLATLLDLNLTENRAGMFNSTYDNDTLGSIEQLKLTPYIKVGANEVPCPGNAVTTTNIKPCGEVWV